MYICIFIYTGPLNTVMICHHFYDVKYITTYTNILTTIPLDIRW